ncbi:hypothetical protein KR51_00032720 [Rubidibacter lacunae KORDI 51-2]|uniref:Uncharacterized protein n=1 Tax=Rubidibacter lacunae KORDI 51-2 TaxID=582515 RepID=U5D6N6_9CHRO|nr:hypothetical protein KR51_00032720 [Rubidibacter lacunae KORDI 51-2]
MADMGSASSRALQSCGEHCSWVYFAPLAEIAASPFAQPICVCIGEGLDYNSCV